MNPIAHRWSRRVSVVLILGFTALPLWAAETNAVPRSAPVDYFEPATLSATIYDLKDSQKVLFNFRRTATRSNSTVQVLREYTRPDGTMVARERVVYEANRLVSFELDEPLSGAHGRALIQPDSKASREPIIVFEYRPNKTSDTKTSRETLRTEALNGDMVGPFIGAHWDELMSGSTLRFRLLALARRETVGFKLQKTSETTWRDKPAVILKMEPSSWIIAQLLDPLQFTVEKDPPHRVFQYSGRTTPKLQVGETWKDLDALTVFSW